MQIRSLSVRVQGGKIAITPQVYANDIISNENTLTFCMVRVTFSLQRMEYKISNDQELVQSETKSCLLEITENTNRQTIHTVNLC